MRTTRTSPIRRWKCSASLPLLSTIRDGLGEKRPPRCCYGWLLQTVTTSHPPLEELSQKRLECPQTRCVECSMYCPSSHPSRLGSKSKKRLILKTCSRTTGIRRDYLPSIRLRCEPVRLAFLLLSKRVTESRRYSARAWFNLLPSKTYVCQPGLNVLNRIGEKLEELELVTRELVNDLTQEMAAACSPFGIQDVYDLEDAVSNSFRVPADWPLNRWEARVHFALNRAIFPFVSLKELDSVARILRVFNPSAPCGQDLPTLNAGRAPLPVCRGATRLLGVDWRFGQLPPALSRA